MGKKWKWIVEGRERGGKIERRGNVAWQMAPHVVRPALTSKQFNLTNLFNFNYQQN